ncbi:MAG: Plug domain-containing protein, partial [Holophagales bacterium]|nr:Plug domain-containing protein [Holophagales bacterium]
MSPRHPHRPSSRGRIPQDPADLDGARRNPMRATSVAVLLASIWIAPLTAQEPPPRDESPTASEVPAATTLDEITVSASYSLNRETPVDAIALSRDQIVELPTFGDDLFRAINLVPGTSGNDVSSAFSVRGAPYEEVLVRLDGVELFAPDRLRSAVARLYGRHGEILPKGPERDRA